MKICLAVDIGNSGLRIAMMNAACDSIGEPLRISWQHSDIATPGRYAPDETIWLGELERFLERAPGAAPKVFRWYVSSVRGDALKLLKSFVCERHQDSWHAIGFHDVPLPARVDFPQRLGIDRLLAAWAASDSTSHRPYVVIQAGSAVTVDLVAQNASGEVGFEGGAILPGVPMIMRLLGKAADMLPEVLADDLTELPPLPGKNTEAAMACGAASALVGGVQHLVSRYRKAYGSDTPVILSGGDGMRLSPHIDKPLVVQPHLVLAGLLKLAQSRA